MMHLLRASAEAANASQSLQQRVEQVRLANWTQLTDPNWVQGTLLNTKTDASVNLPGLIEVLTVFALHLARVRARRQSAAAFHRHA